MTIFMLVVVFGYYGAGVSPASKIASYTSESRCNEAAAKIAKDSPNWPSAKLALCVPVEDRGKILRD